MDAPNVTQRISAVPTLLVVGATQTFLHACRAACEPQGVVVMPAVPAEAPTLAARHRPLVILVLKHVFRMFDEAEFASLARDVGARLATVDGEDLPDDELEVLVIEHITEARWLRE